MSVIVRKDGSKVAAERGYGPLAAAPRRMCKHCRTAMVDVEMGYGVWRHPTNDCPNSGVQVSYERLKNNRWCVPFLSKRERRGRNRAGKLARKHRR